MQIIRHPQLSKSQTVTSAVQSAPKSGRALPLQATDTVTFGMNPHPAESGDTADLSPSATAPNARSTFKQKSSDGNASLSELMDETQPPLQDDFLIDPAESFSVFSHEKGLLQSDPSFSAAQSELEPFEQRLLQASESPANKPARDALVSKLQLAQLSPRLLHQLMGVKNKTERYILMDRVLCNLNRGSKAWTPENLEASHHNNGLVKELEEKLQRVIDEKNKSHPRSKKFDPAAWIRYENLKLNQFYQELKQAPEISMPTSSDLLES